MWMLVMDTTVDFFITKNNDLKVYRKNPKILYKKVNQYYILKEETIIIQEKSLTKEKKYWKNKDYNKKGKVT